MRMRFRSLSKRTTATNIEIELRDLKTILDDVIIGDYAEFHAEETHDDLLGGYAVIIDKFISDRVLQKFLSSIKSAPQFFYKEAI